MSSLALPVTTDGTVAATPVFFRYRGQLQISVVVKASFQLDPSGAVHAIPAELVAVERTYEGNPTRSVEVTSDLAPYKSRCDVILAGHAYAPGGTPTTRSATRLAIVRDDGKKLLDKALQVASPTPFTSVPLTMEQAIGGPGQANPYGTDKPVVVDPVDPTRAGSYAPIARFAPPRKAFAKGIERKALESAVLELPDDMQWDYFQAAPRDQQIEPPRGGEWLVLDGFHPSLPRVQCRLPTQRCVARFGPSTRFREAAEPVLLMCDALSIDADRLILSVVYRGRTTFAGAEHVVPTLMLAAALETPGASIDWARIAATTATSGASASMGRSVDTGTVGIDDFVAPSSGVPFASASAPSSAPRPASREATPWDGGPTAPVVPAKPGQRTLPGEGPSSTGFGPPSSPGRASAPGMRLDQTVTAQHQAPLTARSVTPFPQSTAAPRPPSPEATPFAAAPPFVPPAPPSHPFVAAPAPPPMMTPAPPPMMTPAPPPVVAPPPPPPTVAAPPPPVGSPAKPSAAAPPFAGSPPRPPSNALGLRTPRQPTPPPMSAQRPQSMADSLRKAGASATDLASLASAMAPPPPPPPPEDPD